jgi:hypothetical protein
VAPAQSTSPWSAQSLITGGVIGFGAALLVDDVNGGGKTSHVAAQ